MVLPTKKVVSFQSDEKLCTFRRVSRSRSLDSITKQWYQNSDYDRFLQEIEESVLIAKQAGLANLIQRHYGHTDSETQEMLNAWAMCKETSRGLERLVNGEYGHERLLHRRKTINAVLYAQDKLRKNNRNDARASSIIQTVSSTLSAKSIEFARMMAIADRAAVCPRGKETIAQVVRFGSAPPKGRSPLAQRKNSRGISSPPQRPPRHPGPVRYEIRISPLA
jgi:hypothetical protein